MLQLSTTYYNRKILSLRTGGPIGHALSPIINPNNLKIEGWYATEIGERNPKVLPASEVRDIIHKGIVVDDHTSITDVHDMVRIKDLIDLAFEAIGKNARTESGRKLGRVQDYAVEDKTLFIKKLYVHQSLLKSLKTQQLAIDRDQIIEINDKEIIVKEATEEARVAQRAAAAA